jgi:hypothetical protein
MPLKREEKFCEREREREREGGPLKFGNEFAIMLEVLT